MRNVRKRIAVLEKDVAVKEAGRSNQYRKLERLALSRLSEEQLTSLEQAIEQGRPESQWTERELTALDAFRNSWELEVRRAGYKSIQDFERSVTASDVTDR
jgi:hypothetical protein